MTGLINEFSPRWYVIHTHAKQEGRAENNLLSWNVETFVPRYRARLHNEFKSAPSYTVRPLFPSYLFARLSSFDMLHKVRYTRGVRDILSMGNKPIPLDDAIITTIRERADGKGLVALEDEIKSGDEVIVNGSAFSSFVAIFDRRMKDTERVVVLLKTAYQFSVILPESSIIKNVSRPAGPPPPGSR